MVETCVWISNSSPSRLRPSPATSQTFFPFFIPSCNKHCHNTTKPKSAIHPTLSGRNKSSQTDEGPEHRVRLHPGPGTDRLQPLSAPQADLWTPTDTWVMLLYECLCVNVSGRLSAADSSRFTHTPSLPRPPALVPSQVSRLSERCSSPLRHSASGEPQQHPCHREELPWSRSGYLISLRSIETALFPSALSLPQTGFIWFWTPSIKQHGLQNTGSSSVPTSQEALQHIFSWRFYKSRNLFWKFADSLVWSVAQPLS